MQDEEKYYKRAKRRVSKIKGFYSHLFSFIAVNIVLYVIDLTSGNGINWAYWVTFGWGIGIISHYVNTFGFFGILAKDWEDKKIEEYVKKYKKEDKKTE